MFKFSVSITLFLLLQTTVLAQSHHPQEFLQSITGTKNEGKAIYQHFCSNCHASKPVINLGAPKIASELDWSYRVKQGLDVLFEHTDTGLNAMPPRGGCFECTDEQLLAAIIAMLPEKDKKSLLNQIEDHKKNIKMKNNFKKD